MRTFAPITILILAFIVVITFSQGGGGSRSSSKSKSWFGSFLKSNKKDKKVCETVNGKRKCKKKNNDGEDEDDKGFSWMGILVLGGSVGYRIYQIKK